MRSLLLALGLLLVLVGCGSGANCDAATLTASLMGATSGQVVEIGSCTVHGEFTVPAGVTLRGQGVGSTIITSDHVAIALGDGATLERVRIDHAASHGVAAAMVASVTVRDVEVHSTLGRAALGFADVGTVTLTNVTATGPVTSEDIASHIPADPTETDTALYGVVLLRVGTATLTNVTASGFGAGGVVSSDTALTWTGGGATSDLTLGVWIDAGTATLNGISIMTTLRGFGGNPPYGLAIGRDATVHTVDLVVDDSHQGFGILQDGGDVDHMGLECSGHAGGGIVVQRSASFHVGGGSMIFDNSFAGIVAVQAGGVMVEDSMIANTSLASRLLTSWGGAMVGDAVQLVGPTSTATLSNVDLVASGRAGLLADLDGGDAGLISVSGVTTTGTMQYGCVMQNGTGITMGVVDGLCMRDAPALSADATASGLEIVGIVMPNEIPATDALMGIVMPNE